MEGKPRNEANTVLRQRKQGSGSTLRWWRTTVVLKRGFGTKCAMTTNTNAQTQYIPKHSEKAMGPLMNGKRQWGQAVRLSTQCTNVTPCLPFPDTQSGGHSQRVCEQEDVKPRVN